MDAEESGLSNARLNWLRAAVLGANDGIVSVSAIVLGVAGAKADKHAIFTAGLAGLVAGALSMALGEYVSVSSQRDSERAYIAKEKQALEDNPQEELKELAQIYQNKGLSADTAKQVARELSDHDVIKAHLDAELNIDEADLNNPVQAAVASMTFFTLGGLIPFISILLVRESHQFPVTFGAAVIALCFTGYWSATVGGASRRRAMRRVVIGGILAMLITYGIGHLFGAAVS